MLKQGLPLNTMQNPSSEPSRMNKTIERNWLSCLISVVLATCVVLLILICYKFIHRRHLTFFSSRSIARRQQAPNENEVHDLSSQLRSVGLASAVIHSLPAIQFKKEVNKASGDDNMDCAVCLGEFKEEEWLRYLPNCAHLFHVPCIDTWFQSHSTCPLCRADVLYDFNSCKFSVPGSLRREDTSRERPLGHRLLDSVLMGATSSNATETDSEMTGPKGKGESSTGERNVRALSSLR